LKKIITLLLLGVACLMPKNFTIEMPEIVNVINSTNSIDVVIDDNINTFEKEDDKYNEIIDQLNDMLEGSHEMPAFGVSLDNETKQAKKKGVWIELKYSATYTHNEMPFDTLLIEVQKDWTGFNIYRGNKGKYEGRCFYIDLVNNSMNNLYDTLVS